MKQARIIWFLLTFFACSLYACTSDDTPLGGDTDGDVENADLTEETENAGENPEAETGEQEEAEPGLWDILESANPSLRSILGVSTHMKQNEGESATRDFEFEKYVELGGIRIREDFHWHKIEPADDQWDFSVVDTQVQMARARNMKVLPMLGYGVDWAMTEADNYSSIDPALYGQYAGRVAAQYCDDIKEYEVWNEPNFERFWPPEPDLGHYAEFLKAAYIAIKQACPDARVLTAGFSAYDLTKPFERWWMLDDMKAAVPDICDYFDVFAFHPYTLAQRPSPEYDYHITETLLAEGQIEMTRLARAKLEALGCGEKAIWYTEAGWPSWDLISEEDQTATGIDNEKLQSVYLARSVLLAARDNVEAYFWYTFWDSEPVTEGSRPHEAYFGLFGWSGDPVDNRREKPAWLAFKALADILGDSHFVRDLSGVLGLPNDVFVLLFADEDGGLRLALWDGRDQPDVLPDQPEQGEVWDTSYTLHLPLPDGVTGLGLYDLAGEEVPAPALQPAITLTLTHEVQYLHIER